MGSWASFAEATILHCYISTVAQNRQKNTGSRKGGNFSYMLERGGEAYLVCCNLQSHH